MIGRTNTCRAIPRGPDSVLSASQLPNTVLDSKNSEHTKLPRSAHRALQLLELSRWWARTEKSPYILHFIRTLAVLQEAKF